MRSSSNFILNTQEAIKLLLGMPTGEVCRPLRQQKTELGKTC